jgi:hypothetical protein
VSAEDACRDLREFAPEVALGIADDETRARIRAHADGCPACRSELARLSTLVDEILRLAPERQPSRAFQERTLRAMQRPTTAKLPPIRAQRTAALLIAALLAAGTATAATLFAVRHDRQLAAHYRAALSTAHGSAFDAAELRTPNGTRAGTVFTYQGAPSWAFITIDRAYRSLAVRAAVVTTRNHIVPLPSYRPRAGSWGGVLPLEPATIRSFRLTDAVGRTVLVAYLAKSW